MNFILLRIFVSGKLLYQLCHQKSQVIKIETETHTVLFGADPLLREVSFEGDSAYANGKPVSEIYLRVAYVIHERNSSLTLGLRLPHRRTTVEYNIFSDEFKKGDLVSARVVKKGRAYKVIELVSP